jgi:hypothetical protein
LFDAPHIEPGGNPRAAHSWGLIAIPGTAFAKEGDPIGDLFDAPHIEPGGNPRAVHSWGLIAVPGTVFAKVGDPIGSPITIIGGPMVCLRCQQGLWIKNDGESRTGEFAASPTDWSLHDAAIARDGDGAMAGPLQSCRCSELRDYKRKKVPVDDREIHKVVTNSDSTRNGRNARARAPERAGVPALVGGQERQNARSGTEGDGVKWICLF